MHPLLNKFDENTSPQDLHDQCCDIYNRTDKHLFKKEREISERTMEQNVESANESSAEVEYFTNGALALQRERLIRIIQNDGRISIQGGSNDGVDSDSVLLS